MTNLEQEWNYYQCFWKINKNKVDAWRDNSDRKPNEPFPPGAESHINDSRTWRFLEILNEYLKGVKI